MRVSSSASFTWSFSPAMSLKGGHPRGKRCSPGCSSAERSSPRPSRRRYGSARPAAQTARDMTTPRLVIFCSDVDTNLAPAMDSLADLFELAKVSAPRLVNIVPPDALRAAGYRALTIQGERLT